MGPLRSPLPLEDVAVVGQQHGDPVRLAGSVEQPAERQHIADRPRVAQLLAAGQMIVDRVDDCPDDSSPGSDRGPNLARQPDLRIAQCPLVEEERRLAMPARGEEGRMLREPGDLVRGQPLDQPAGEQARARVRRDARQRRQRERTPRLASAPQLRPPVGEGIVEQLGRDPVAHPVEDDDQHGMLGGERRCNLGEQVLDSEQLGTRPSVHRPCGECLAERALLGGTALVRGAYQRSQGGVERGLLGPVPQHRPREVGVAGGVDVAPGCLGQIPRQRWDIGLQPALEPSREAGDARSARARGQRVFRHDLGGELDLPIALERSGERSQPRAQSAA